MPELQLPKPRHQWSCYWAHMRNPRVRECNIIYCMHCGMLEEMGPQGVTATDLMVPCVRTPLDVWAPMFRGQMHTLQTAKGTATVERAWSGAYHFDYPASAGGSPLLVLDRDQFHWEAFLHNQSLDVEKGYGFADTLEEAQRAAEAYYASV